MKKMTTTTTVMQCTSRNINITCMIGTDTLNEENALNCGRFSGEHSLIILDLVLICVSLTITEDLFWARLNHIFWYSYIHTYIHTSSSNNIFYECSNDT
mmetsp:Transcript_22101/g.25582  ORF Transcript_22101/g.25582 Transcript_22101/m.25582 type:complete len:99 (-) Transcript_22101:105-401(-)